MVIKHHSWNRQKSLLHFGSGQNNAVEKLTHEWTESLSNNNYNVDPLWNRACAAVPCGCKINELQKLDVTPLPSPTHFQSQFSCHDSPTAKLSPSLLISLYVSTVVCIPT